MSTSVASFQPFDLGDFAACSGACSDRVATPVAASEAFPDWGKGADYRHFARTRTGAVASVAELAGGRDFSPPWAAGLIELQRLPCPAFVPGEAWEMMVYLALSVSRDWGRKALDLGWTGHDLFGCHPKPWCTDHSQDGLVPLLGSMSPLTIVDVSEDHALLQDRHGFALRYLLRNRPKAVLMWHAYALEGGP